jgi:hypothetical protein
VGVVSPRVVVMSAEIGAATGIPPRIGWIATGTKRAGVRDGTLTARGAPLAARTAAGWRSGVWRAPAGDGPLGTLTTSDDVVPAFAHHGTTSRPVDVTAHTAHVIGLRMPGSFVDTLPGNTGRVGTCLQRGSGTCEATVIIAGVAALAVQEVPGREARPVQGPAQRHRHQAVLGERGRLPSQPDTPHRFRWARRGRPLCRPGMGRCRLLRQSPETVETPVDVILNGLCV